ncbi:YfiT family bacillithiol transferase [Snuella lapsa]|uniref:Bacillithiol transferase BstA n=1 Tax=Snuella lapsa TaxID=870481 RepID=A0ABP6XIJ7_9FLAO
MTNKELEHLKYPIGKFESPAIITTSQVEAWISVLDRFPDRLESLVGDLTDEQLDTAYRPEGWTVRQVIHHLADSHLNSYIRFKWTLTEDTPVIKPYNEARWAELPGAKDAPIAMSLLHLKVIHYKLVYLLKQLSEEELGRIFIHPETNTEVPLNRNIGVYAWHSNHHYAHIENLLKRNNWL